MRIFLDNRPHTLRGATVADLLRECDVNRETVLVEVNGSLVTSDRQLRDDDRVSFIPVFSGG